VICYFFVLGVLDGTFTMMFTRTKNLDIAAHSKVKESITVITMNKTLLKNGWNGNGWMMDG
jgi:hypothetical protein